MPNLSADLARPLTDALGRDIWLAARESEFGIVLSVPNPRLAPSIRDRLNRLRAAYFPDDPRIRDLIIHVPADCATLTIKPRLANVLP